MINSNLGSFKRLNKVLTLSDTFNVNVSLVFDKDPDFCIFETRTTEGSNGILVFNCKNGTLNIELNNLGWVDTTYSPMVYQADTHELQWNNRRGGKNLEIACYAINATPTDFKTR